MQKTKHGSTTIIHLPYTQKSEELFLELIWLSTCSILEHTTTTADYFSEPLIELKLGTAKSTVSSGWMKTWTNTIFNFKMLTLIVAFDRQSCQTLRHHTKFGKNRTIRCRVVTDEYQRYVHCESKKLCHFYFYCNFGKCWSIFKILSMSESERNGS